MSPPVMSGYPPTHKSSARRGVTPPLFLSLFFHLLFAALLFFLAASPGKALPPGRIEQVFLVSEAPTAFVPVGARFIEPAGGDEAPPLPIVGQASRLSKVSTVKLTSIKPEKSLAEKLATRLTGAASESWNRRTITRPEEPREKSGAPTETEKEVLPPRQGSLEQASVSTGEGAARVESESGFSDGWYLTLLSRRLSERWNPVREGIAVVSREVTVSFTITRDGRIRDVNLVRASGNPRFDRSGLTAVAESDFLPSLPANWGKKELHISVRFREK